MLLCGGPICASAKRSERFRACTASDVRPYGTRVRRQLVERLLRADAVSTFEIFAGFFAGVIFLDHRHPPFLGWMARQLEHIF